MTPGEYTEAMRVARTPGLDSHERARRVGKALGVTTRDHLAVLEEALDAASDQARSLAAEEVCVACPGRFVAGVA